MVDERDDFDFEETYTDFEIEENVIPNKVILKKCNEFESFEIEIPDDIDEEMLVAIEEENLKLLKVPEVQVTFWNDSNIPLVVEHDLSKMGTKKSYICEYCSKAYLKEIYYAKHISSCQLQQERSDASNDDTLSRRNKDQHPATTPSINQQSSSTKQRKKTIQDKVLATDEDLISLSSDMFLNSLTKATKDQNHIRKRKHLTPGNKIKILAEAMLSVLSNDKMLLQTESEKIVSKISNIVKTHDLSKAASREDMWKQILEHLQNENNFVSWNDIAKEHDFPSDAFTAYSGLYYYVTMNICEAIVKLENQKLSEKNKPPEQDTISPDEQNSIYYVAGYIIFSLIKKYKKLAKAHPDDPSVNAILVFLSSVNLKSSVTVRGTSFLDFAREWTNILDRGGLVNVNDDMFLFIRNIENHVRQILNVDFLKSYRGEDLRDVLVRKLNEHNLLNNYWEKLTRFIPSPQVSYLLKEQVITKWIDIRAHAFVKSFIQILRRKAAKDASEKKVLSEAAERSLRKGLS